MKIRIIIIYLLCYVFLDWVSYVHPVLPIGITPWNPPPGLSLFLLLVFGLRYWPVLFVAALAADIIVRGAPAPWPVLVESAALLTGSYTLAAYYLKKYFQAPVQFLTLRNLGVFLVVIISVTALVATGYVLLYMVVGRVPVTVFWSSLFRHWIGDLNGILVFTPVLLAWVNADIWRRSWLRPHLVEIGIQAGSIVLVLWLIFGLPVTNEFKFFYLLFLPLIWIAVRWGFAGATMTLLAIQLGLIVAVQLGGYHAATFVQFQFLMFALCVTGLVLGAVVTQRVTAEKQLYEKQVELDRAMQFAAAGEMTSALAHELNQPITAITNYLRSCQVLLDKQQTENNTMLYTAMNKAIMEARRAGQVVNRLRGFFLRGSLDIQSVSLKRFVNDVVKGLADRAAQANIIIKTQFDSTIQNVDIDPTQIAIVLHNVLINAIEAMAEKKVVSSRELQNVIITVNDDEKNLYLVIEDSGISIDSQTAETMFEPFVTSKPQGMGLGLAISRNLVKGHGGALIFEHAVNGGAKFIIRLPIK